MSERTGIAWTDHTWSPWWGCAEVSPACDNCYARELDARYGGAHWGAGAPRKSMSDGHWKQPLAWNRKTPPGATRLVFPSMCDPFDNHDTAAAIRPRFFDLMRATPHLTWLLLTKRIGNAARMADECGGWPANAWAGATVVTQAEADRDIPKLLALDGPRIRFVSIEPMLEAIDLTLLDFDGASGLHALEKAPRGLDWVIVGGESGAQARPMHPDWPRAIRDQCATAGVPFFFKQWGEWIEHDHHVDGPYVYEVEAGTDEAKAALIGCKRPGWITRDGRFIASQAGLLEDNPARLMDRLGKTKAGCVLDGRVHCERPAP